MDGGTAASAGIFGPLWGTVLALGDLTVRAEAGTGLFAFVLLILSLEFLREAKGLFVPVGRAAVLGSLVFSACYAAYGDFLLEPAKAVFAQLPTGPKGYHETPWLAAGLGAAGVGIGFYAGQRACAPIGKRAAALPSQTARTAVSNQRRTEADRGGSTGLPQTVAAAIRKAAKARVRNRKKAACPKVKRSAPRPAAKLRGQVCANSEGSS